MAARSSWALLAVSFVAGLAGVVRMAAPIDPADHVSGVIRLSRPLTAVILLLFGLAAAVFLAAVLRQGLALRRRTGDGEDAAEDRARIPTWLRTVSQIASFLYFALLAYAFWRGGLPLLGLLGGQGGGSSASGALPRALSEDAPTLITWTFAALALAAGATALAAAVVFAARGRLGRERRHEEAEPELERVESAVDESLDDLRAEPDARRAIVRCYGRFERAAAASGVARRPCLTPMEYTAEVVGRLAVRGTAIPTLTALFELARFSHHPVGRLERDRALRALDEIRAALASRIEHAARN